MDEQKREKKRAQSSGKRRPRISGKYFRLVIPNLGRLEGLDRVRGGVLFLLKDREKRRGLEYYCIAVETHPTTREHHLGVLVLYGRRVWVGPGWYGYLVKHGGLTRYRRLNAAVLAYGLKQDPSPLSNLPGDLGLVLRAARVALEPYDVMAEAMQRDPWGFKPHEWLLRENLARAYSRKNWAGVVRLVEKQREVLCNRLLRAKPGIRTITRELVEERLSREELGRYGSWGGYQLIVGHLNQISVYGTARPFKTKNLLLVGPPGTGKSSLVLEVGRWVSMYYKDVGNWFPRYESGVYGLILWGEFHLRSMPYPNLLKFLQGLMMDLEFKGGSTLRSGNQLILMTSNLTLREHVRFRFSSTAHRNQSELNLRARITEVVLPEGFGLFFLQGLIVPCGGVGTVGSGLHLPLC